MKFSLILKNVFLTCRPLTFHSAFLTGAKMKHSGIRKDNFACVATSGSYTSHPLTHKVPSSKESLQREMRLILSAAICTLTYILCILILCVCRGRVFPCLRVVLHCHIFMQHTISQIFSSGTMTF